MDIKKSPVPEEVPTCTVCGVQMVKGTKSPYTCPKCGSNVSVLKGQQGF